MAKDSILSVNEGCPSDDCVDCPLFLDFKSCGYERSILDL